MVCFLFSRPSLPIILLSYYLGHDCLVMIVASYYQNHGGLLSYYPGHGWLLSDYLRHGCLLMIVSSYYPGHGWQAAHLSWAQPYGHGWACRCSQVELYPRKISNYIDHNYHTFTIFIILINTRIENLPLNLFPSWPMPLGNIKPCWSQ